MPVSWALSCGRHGQGEVWPSTSGQRHDAGSGRQRMGSDVGMVCPGREKHAWAMPIELLLRQNRDWFSHLASDVWFGNPFARKKLMEFLSTVRPARRIRCVPRTGWDNAAYILPDVMYSVMSGERVVLQSLSYASLYCTAGTLDGWREIAKLYVSATPGSASRCAWPSPGHCFALPIWEVAV